MGDFDSRRSFLRNAALGSFGAIAAGGLLRTAAAQTPDAKILGESGVKTSERPKGVWKPVSDRKLRVGIVGYGACQFGSAFGFQDHPNVTVTAVSDLFPDRCSELAKACRCEKTYPSLEELVKDDTIEAVFVATDAPSHARHCIDVLKHGKHVATAVPAVFGSIEDAHKLLEVVKSSGRKYMMFETSAFHEDCYAMRQIYRAGGFGKLVYSEGEYFHYMPTGLPSYKDWRTGLPPQWYPTHANAYYVKRDRRQLHRGFVPGDAEQAQEISTAEQRLQERFLDRDRPVANERGRDGAHGRQFRHARLQRRDRPRARPARVDDGNGIRRAGKDIARSGPPAFAAERRPRRTRRLAWPPDE